MRQVVYGSYPRKNLVQHALFVALVACWSTPATAQEYAEFDDSFLHGNGAQEKVDVSRFNYGNTVPAGDYLVDVYLNQQEIGRLNIRFIDIPSRNTTGLCATPSLLSALDLHKDLLKDNNTDDIECPLLTELIPESKVNLDMAKLRLNLELPQALIINRPIGYISPSRWQNGAPVAFVRYDASHYRYKYGNQETQQSFLGLEAGVNLFGWVLRHRGNKTWIPGFKTSYQNISTYAQHDIPFLRGQLKLGDFYTDGLLMDSVSIRGAQITSDDRMLAPSERGFAPIVRGIAHSNAKVTIRQNGVTLRQLSVPAGEFEINDLYPTGYGGDIDVEIQEANGEIRTFSIPFSSSAQLIRPGYAKYSIAAGRFRDITRIYDTKVAQASLQYGLSNNFTLNLGATVAKNYHAELAGLSFNTPIGAFATNMTVSHAKLSQKTYRGYSISANYNTRIEPTDTDVTLAAYRYSSKDYYRLSDVIYANEGYPIFEGYDGIGLLAYRPKNQLQISISQRLKKDWGYFYLSGSSYTYWGTKQKQHQYQIGYSNSYKDINYSLSLSQSKNNWGEKNTGVYLSLSIPLGKESTTHLYQSLSHSQSDGFSSNTSLSGNLGENNDFGYGVYLNKQRHSTSIGANLSYTNPLARFGSSWSHSHYSYPTGSSNGQQMSFTVSGAVVVHPKGITLANDISDTFAIIHAKGARGARINGSYHGVIDYFGNGIVPYLEPYAVNSIGIDTSKMEDNVELSAVNQEVIPRANQAMLINFETKTGKVVFFEITGTADLPPMGTEVFDQEGQSIGVVAQGGRIYTRAVAEKGRLNMSWGDKQCAFNYALNPATVEATNYPVIIPVQCEKSPSDNSLLSFQGMHNE